MAVDKKSKPIFSCDLIYTLKKKESICANKDFEDRFKQYLKDAKIHNQSNYTKKLIEQALRKEGVKSIRDLLLLNQLDREVHEFESKINNTLVDWFKSPNFSKLVTGLYEKDMKKFYKKNGGEIEETKLITP